MTVTEAPDEATARDRGRGRRRSVAIVLPADLRERRGEITIITNGLDPAGEAAQVGSSGRHCRRGRVRGGRRLPDHRARDGLRRPRATTRSRPSRRRSSRSSLYFFVYLLTGVSFLRERTGGTLERLMATPVTRGEVVAGYTLGFGLFATLQVAVLMTWVAGDRPRAGDRAAARVLDRARDPGGGQPAPRVPRRGAARPGRGEPRDLPLDVRPHGAAGHPVHPDRAGAAVPALGRAVPGQQPAGRSCSRSSRSMPLAYAVDGLRQVFIRGAGLGVPERSSWDLAVLSLVAVPVRRRGSLTIRRDVV